MREEGAEQGKALKVMIRERVIKFADDHRAHKSASDTSQTGATA